MFRLFEGYDCVVFILFWVFGCVFVVTLCACVLIYLLGVHEWRLDCWFLWCLKGLLVWFARV